MKTLALALALFLAGDSLVDVAKQAKAKRRKSASKVLTNDDVKKSKGKIQTTQNVSSEPVTPEPTLMEKHVAARAAEAAAAERKAKAEALVAALEKELAAIEQSYYGENDLARRDGEIVKKFDEVKAKLDAARAALPKSE